MDNMDLDVLRRVDEWRGQGHAVTLGTITRTWGSAPRPVGSVVAIRGDGRVAGSVSGGCIEDDLIDRVRRGALAVHRPECVRYGVGAEEAMRFGLPCGGTLELVLEPVGERSRIGELLSRLGEGQRVRRRLDLATGEVQLDDPRAADELHLTDRCLITTHGPRWRVLIIGAGQLTQYLADMARALDYQVTVCDPREEYADTWVHAGVHLTREMPDDAVLAFRPDGHTAIIALTHDPKLDDLALLEALASPAFYVGALGSRVNQARRRERLAQHFGLTDTSLDRLHGPVGLKNGARTPPEIAVSILAHMTQVRYATRQDLPAPEAGCVVA